MSKIKSKKPPPPLSVCSSTTSCRTSRTTIVRKSKYQRIKSGLKKSNPAAIVLWAFHKIPSANGLTSRRVINFLKQHFRTVHRPQATGKSLGAMLRCAVEFGLLKKYRNRYFLADHAK